MVEPMKRRTVLKGGGAAAAASVLPAAAVAATADRAEAGTILFDPSIARASQLARREPGRALALDGDRVRFWRSHLTAAAAPIAGFTSWSDYVLLRGLAEEQGLRLRREVDLSPTVTGTLIAWVVA